MLDELRAHIAGHLASHSVAVLSTASSNGMYALSVRYRLLEAGLPGRRGLALACPVPNWADLLFYIEQAPQVALTVQATKDGVLWWLSVHGTAKVAALPDWSAWALPATHSRPAHLFTVLHVQPERIEIVDERDGWGARETLDL